MELNKETILLQNETRKFSREVIAEKVDEFDKKGAFPSETIKRLAEMGILGAIVPENFGGAALDTIGTLVVLEEIGKVCPSTALIIATHNALFAYPILKSGSDEQKKKYLPKAGSGEIIGGFAETATNELAVKFEGENYIIKGKNPILLNAETNGPFILIAPLENNFNVLIIDSNLNGVVKNKKGNIIGMRSAGINEVSFNNCVVPKTNVLGEQGADPKILEEIKNFANLCFSAIALGIAEGALENAIKYAKERVQFGEPIINFSMVREMIADMTIKIESARLLIYDTAVTRDAGKDFIRNGAIARSFINQAVAEITTSAIQIYGGYGYMKDYPVERYFRDAQVIRVLCGSSIKEKEFIVKRTI